MRTWPVAIAIAILPSLARAQTAPEPTQCTTTTTTVVKCTGAAAPLAVPPDPASAPAPVPPPAYPPPAYPPPQPIYPPFACVSPACGVGCPARCDGKLGHGWRLTLGPDGSLWRERRVRTPSGAAVGTGLALLAVSYLPVAIDAFVERSDLPAGAWPVFGAFMNAAIDGSSNGVPMTFLWILDGMAQTAGILTTLIGLATGPGRIERQRVTFGAVLAPGGGALSLQGRF